MDIDTYMAECMSKRFQWGTFDCFLFAAGAVQAKTGVDHMANLRGYGDETSAAILLQDRFGTLNLRDVFLEVAGHANAKQVPHIQAAYNGDIACVQWPHKFEKASVINQSTGLGVVYRDKVYACAPGGVFRVPPTHRVLDIWSF
ncbi:MAG: 19, gp19 [Marmoricola sp.]|nr:19, gp19 [Marmoricola sp.]